MMWVVSVCVLMVVCVRPGCTGMSQARDLTPELLKTIMSQILHTYGKGIKVQYSLAISVPWNSGTYDYQAVFKKDPANSDFFNVLNQGHVYTGHYVVAAKVQKKREHTEWRVLGAVKKKINKNAVLELKGRDLLILYTLNSPCLKPCTTPNDDRSILDMIKVMKNWHQYAVVFTKAFLPNAMQDKDKEYKESRYKALDNLSETLGIDHIYRCLENGECFNCAQKTRCVALDGYVPFIEKFKGMVLKIGNLCKRRNNVKSCPKKIN